MATEDRGERVMTVSREALCSGLLKDTPARTIELPDDVEIEELWHHPEGYGYQIRISSTEWDAQTEGEPLPEINPTIEVEVFDDG
jgi:hypothetical protein